MRFRALAVSALLAAASFAHLGTASAAAPVDLASQRIAAEESEECGPFVGAQRVNGTGFDTCVPGGEWVYQDCAPGTVSVQGFGAARYRIWCIIPD
ncbi:hypothetical protein [Streptomyces sp. NBC_01429]|uniref:hypothetical protein n=1 Tax=Streptomyces sp. NBC_01429 TaxID=2903862 RepID=UPI002E27B356|nr:hypothetical protein [Streptomyces sp. NBC_01429]